VTQLAFALFDLIYRALTEGLATTAIRFRRNLEQEIHSNEITQEALTSKRMAASARCPLSPTADQTVFRVAILQTVSVSSVETVILENPAMREKPVPNDRPSRVTWL
jgi:hypothetical protein